MSISRAKKDARNKWDAENMCIVGCKVKRELAEKFKAAAIAANTSPNAILKECIERFLKEHEEIAQLGSNSKIDVVDI